MSRPATIARSHVMKTSMHIGIAVTVLALAGGCSDPAGPLDCPEITPAQGVPFFSLPSALRGTGATVEELGQRLDLKAFIEAPTMVLSVDGAEVLYFPFCTGTDAARALGHYGVGVYAVSPPNIVVNDPDYHVFAMASVLATYEGRDAALLAALTSVMGGEVALPGR